VHGDQIVYNKLIPINFKNIVLETEINTETLQKPLKIQADTRKIKNSEPLKFETVSLHGDWSYKEFTDS